jgi:adenosylcobyric acid synthase
MHSLSLFGTGSDAGKSTMTMALCRLLHEAGYRVAPFKAQNVSNNARIGIDGCEIAQAQSFAAEACGCPQTYHLNPILLKSGAEGKASMILNGKSAEEIGIAEYYAGLEAKKPLVDEAFEYLQARFDIVVAEGAGSPVELNLMEKDLSNLYVAERFDTKIVLVADIERGGVFASVWGVYNLLPEHLRANVIGVIVNKFRGDLAFFDDGVTIIEERFGLKVLGVVPYLPLNLGFEDIQSLEQYRQNDQNALIDVAVIRFPTLSNFTDFEPLINDDQLKVRFITRPEQIADASVLILPGTRRTMEDLAWLREQGFEPVIKNWTRMLIAVCGGYEMLFERIVDEEGIETQGSMEGLGMIQGEIRFEKTKVQRSGNYELFGHTLQGYELHHGTSADHPLGYREETLYGTFLHGLFDNDAWRNALFASLHPDYRPFGYRAFREARIADFAEGVKAHLDLDDLIRCLHRKEKQ